MPETYLVSSHRFVHRGVADLDRTDAASFPHTRAAWGLPDDAFVFASFNMLHKVSFDVFEVWMRILIAVPGSVLWLLPLPADAEDYLHQAAELLGVNRNRLVGGPEQAGGLGKKGGGAR